MTGAPIRDAATVILVRDAAARPAVLMGQRGRGAAFMPSKFVFPGGAVDAGDTHVPLARGLSELCVSRLAKDAGIPPAALAATAIRELWEETGLILGARGVWVSPPADWTGFAAAGFRPDAAALRFFFRAVTPPGRPRRFDARFFLVSAEALAGDPDDVPTETDELSRIGWVPLDEVRRLDLPFVTELVLAELAAHLPRLDAPARVPFVRNDAMDSSVVWL